MARLTHLQRLESESIAMMREAVAESERPVMLYSVGKDRAVVLHLAMKAFYPGVPNRSEPRTCRPALLGPGVRPR